MRISDWSSDVCSSDLHRDVTRADFQRREVAGQQQYAAAVGLRGIKVFEADDLAAAAQPPVGGKPCYRRLEQTGAERAAMRVDHFCTRVRTAFRKTQLHIAADHPTTPARQRATEGESVSERVSPG